jgi:hypothetical protein
MPAEGPLKGHLGRKGYGNDADVEADGDKDATRVTTTMMMAIGVKHNIKEH